MLLSCGCEILSLIKKEEQRWRLFEIRMLRKILKPKRKNIVGR
jgi:hypothetical protein